MKKANVLWARAAIVLSAFLIAFGASAQASTVPGALSGELGVSPNGAATYQLPIQAPPGIAGMTPKIALVYNSQAGNGLLGKGWSIQGLSSIRRCPQTMASDGVRGRISYTQADRFCLDDQHLVVVAGLYGGHDSEYRSEIDPFSRIRAIVSDSSANGPQHFIVQTKDGITLEFGNSNDSRIEAQGKTVVRSWLLSRMIDTLGNAIEFHYTEDNASGEARIERISYAGRSMVFTYEFRHDTQLAYQLGSAVRITERLKAIETRIDAHLVHRYDITYTYGSTTGLSRVNTITQCAGDGSCLPPLIFQHSNSTELGSFDSGVRIINEPTLTLANNGSNTVNPELPDQEQLATKLADLNRDGALDMLYAITGPSGARVYRLLGNGDGSFQAATVLINQPSLGSTAGCTPELTDVNGDSLDDLLYVCAQSSGAKVHEWLGRSDGSFQWAGTLLNDSAWGNLSTFQAHIADINGDGIVDLLYTHADISGAMALKWLGRGDGSFHAGVLATRSPNTITFEGFRPSLVDLNNDGLLDLLYTYTGSFGAAAYWFPNNGEGSFHAPQLVLNTNSFGNTAGCAPYVADLNNDGSADLLYACAKSSGAFAY
ncbi:MAG TPA: FG-GAP-like repeat-containing protein, partial [Burkholderiaceae bacterium]|nr:FG-GAP-like repeat-containing protein [Burkholderiaceae bacterium]